MRAKAVAQEIIIAIFGTFFLPFIPLVVLVLIGGPVLLLVKLVVSVLGIG